MMNESTMYMSAISFQKY